MSKSYLAKDLNSKSKFDANNQPTTLEKINNKKFSELNKKEKDELLKFVAIRLGLILE